MSVAVAVAVVSVAVAVEVAAESVATAVEVAAESVATAVEEVSATDEVVLLLPAFVTGAIVRIL